MQCILSGEKEERSKIQTELLSPFPRFSFLDSPRHFKNITKPCVINSHIVAIICSSVAIYLILLLI